MSEQDDGSPQRRELDRPWRLLRDDEVGERDAVGS